MTKSMISNFQIAISIHGSNTRVNVLSCRLRGCYLGVDILHDASCLVSESILETDGVACVLKNTSGVVEFKGNVKLKGNEVGWPLILVDRISKPVIHDFENVDVQFHQPRTSLNSRKTQSKFSEQTSQLVSESAFLHRLLTSPSSARDACLRVSDIDYKYCRHCGTAEDRFKSGFKFKYCSSCHRVCYCSKECQTADWKDHKFGCGKDPKLVCMSRI